MFLHALKRKGRHVDDLSSLTESGLSSWQPSVKPVTKKASSWRLVRLSVWCWKTGNCCITKMYIRLPRINTDGIITTVCILIPPVKLYWQILWSVFFLVKMTIVLVFCITQFDTGQSCCNSSMSIVVKWVLWAFPSMLNVVNECQLEN